MINVRRNYPDFGSFVNAMNEYVKFEKNDIDVRIVRTDIKESKKAIDEFLRGGGFKEKERYGCIIHITKVITLYGKKQIVNILLYYDEIWKTFYLFTNEGISKMDIVLNFVDNHRNFHEIWLPPSDFEEFSDDLLDKETGELIYFKAERDKSILCDRRPEIYRKTEYQGKDGRLVLKEWKIEYGVLPVKLEFHFPDKGVFKIYRSGRFVFRYGNFKFFILDIVKEFILHAIKIDKIFEDSIFDVKIIDGFPSYTMKTVEIELTKGFDKQKYEEFISLLEKNNFATYNEVLSDEGILASGYVVDKNKNEIFSLALSGSSISLLPKYKAKYHSLHRFYRFIVENINSSAKCR